MNFKITDMQQDLIKTKEDCLTLLKWQKNYAELNILKADLLASNFTTSLLRTFLSKSNRKKSNNGLIKLNQHQIKKSYLIRKYIHHQLKNDNIIVYNFLSSLIKKLQITLFFKILSNLTQRSYTTILKCKHDL